MAVRRVIFHLSTELRNDIYRTVSEAVKHWPNAHLGEYTALEDIRRAFNILRQRTMHTGDIRVGINALQMDVFRHMDM